MELSIHELKRRLRERGVTYDGARSLGRYTFRQWD